MMATDLCVDPGHFGAVRTKQHQPQCTGAHPKSVSGPSKPEEPLPGTSSMPMDIPEKQATLFSEVLLVLKEKHFQHAVSGAFALSPHTRICLFTKDLDL